MSAIGKSPFLKVLCAGLVLYVVCALLTLRHGDRSLYPAAAATIPVYVLNNGFHTDIVVPADQVMARGGVLAEAGRAAGQAKWLVYGWGDAGFYTAKGFSVARAVDGLRALFWVNNPSVIRVYGIDRTPDQAFVGDVATRVMLSPAGFDAMTRRMSASFATDKGAPVTYPVASVSDAAFFTSGEHFSIARVCNNWTADQLAAAGLPTAPMLDGVALLLKLDLGLRAGVR